MQVEALFILQNYSEAVTWARENSPRQIFLCSMAKSMPQEKHFQQRALSLLALYPEIKIITKDQLVSLLKEFKNIAVSCWQAPNEVSLFNCENLKVTYLPSNTLVSEFMVSNKDSFTQFRKKIEQQLPEKYTSLVQYEDLQQHEHLNNYFNQPEVVKSYFNTRNQLIGNSFSTDLSSYLACGSLNVRYLYNQVKSFEEEYGANKSTYWIVFELLWREFFYHSGQSMGSLIFSKDGLRCPANYSPYYFDEKDLALKLRSKELIFCAYKELTQTGYLSNRVRQIFASYLINDLQLDWRIGAELFETYLIDYDVFSNYGNWQYLAGVGHDSGGPRYFNIEKQLKNYDPLNLYIQYWRQK